MPLIDLVQNKAWALYPAKLDEINAFIEARMEDPKLSIEVARGKSGNKADDRYAVENGVATIPVYGVIDKRANLFMEISGGTSTELLKRDIRTAINDPGVDAIVLDIDSPGGSVDGTKELSDFIFESRGIKPIVAYANGMMTSAAYWIGSSADQIIANDTAVVGSIGVALTHYDKSAADAKNGVKRTVIYAGKYKRIASDEKPLCEDGREYLQSMVDTYYELFVTSIAQNRGVDVETVLKRMADGRDFIGKQAKEAGLVDNMGNLDTAVSTAKQEARKNMDIEKLKADHPEIYQAVFGLGAKSVDTAKLSEEAKQAGITEERARVAAILSEQAADPAAKEKAIAEGLTVDAAYKLFFQAETAKRKEKLAETKDNRPKSAGASGQPKDNPAADGFMAAVDKKMSEAKCTRGKAIAAVATENPELHQAYLESLAKK